MVTYKLEETPNTYISPCIDNPDGRFVYRMVHFDGESNWRIIREIDLRNDELIIHGTRINESMLQKLHASLVLRPKTGKIYVNCNGACYIVVTGKGNVRPIDNVIFDWSPFGVIVPNSVNDSLRKQLQQKDQELAASSNMASLEALKQEMEEVKQQLSGCRKDQEDIKMELKKVRSQLSSKELEFEAIKVEFESSKDEVKGLQEQLCSSKKESDNMKTELQNMQNQLSLFEVELQSSNKNMKEYVTELQKVQNEISSGKVELESAKSELESCYNKMKQLEQEHWSSKKESEVKEAELDKIEDQVSSTMNELPQSINILFEFTYDKDYEDKSFAKSYVIKAIEIVDD